MDESTKAISAVRVIVKDPVAKDQHAAFKHRSILLKTGWTFSEKVTLLRKHGVFYNDEWWPPSAILKAKAVYEETNEGD